MLKDPHPLQQSLRSRARRHPEVAYRPLEPDACLEQSSASGKSQGGQRQHGEVPLALQLLPGMERPSYAGTVVEVLEGLDGQLAVRYQGEIIPSQEAPPRPGMLAKIHGSSSHGAPARRPQRSGQALGSSGGTRRRVAGPKAHHRTSDNGVASSGSPASRKPTPETAWVERCARSAGACRFESCALPARELAIASGHGEEIHVRLLESPAR